MAKHGYTVGYTDGGMMGDRREHGSGSVYQIHAEGCPRPTNAKGKSTCKCKWRGSADAGFTASGGRRRLTVSGKTEADVQRKVRDKLAEIKQGEVVMSPTTTVKAWSDTWLPIKRSALSPKGYAALSGPIRQWVIPTIGQKRLRQLGPADVRAIELKQRAAGLKGTTAAATQRALFTMLRAAIAEGHAVPPRVLMTPMPKTSPSDRQPLTPFESLSVLVKAIELPHATRWAVALLCGMRQGECLGLTWDTIDFDAGVITVEWQLQRLPYADKRDRSKGFRYPDEYEYRHLYKAWHLVRPKSKAGFRAYPIPDYLVAALLSWREVAPDSPWGLVWPNADGKPRLHTDDLEEWHELQAEAGVSHPSGRPYHVHECRNVTATELARLKVSESTMTALMGHTSIQTSRGYVRVDLDVKRQAVEQVGDALGLAKILG